MRGVRVDVVYPPSRFDSQNYSSEPPLGPIALYSALPEEWKRQVRFLDGTLLTQSEILSGVALGRADVVALSATTFNYGNCLEVARTAKKHGAVVVLGGIHVTHLFDRVVRRRLVDEGLVDCVVWGYGEVPLLKILEAVDEERNYQGIAGVAWKDLGGCHVEPPARARGTEDPLQVPLDFGIASYSEYAKRFRGLGRLAGVERPASLYTQRGCAYVGARKCNFCSIEEINPRRLEWLIERDVMSLLGDHNIDHVRISDGDFTTSLRHMRMVAGAVKRAKEKVGREATFYCFARADEIDDDRITVLKDLNVVGVFIGYESGSDRMLSGMHKNTTREMNLRSTAMLAEAGIDITCSGLVLGAEGEDQESLRDTVSFVEALARIGNVRSVVATPLIPLPGSPSFRTLTDKVRRIDNPAWRYMTECDDLDPRELAQLWNKNMANVSMADLATVTAEIEGAFEIGIRFM